MNIRITQIDGILPNIALMKLSYHFKKKGDNVFFEKSVYKNLFEPDYDLVFGSVIFSENLKKTEIFKANFENAIVGGTGLVEKDNITIEGYLKIPENYKQLDYSIYPDFKYSIGFTQVGCSSQCTFCCVPGKEGKNRPVANIKDIHRAGTEKKLILLDNDFQNRKDWQIVCEDIINNDYEVAFIQGINIRKITTEHIPYFRQIKFRDKNFTQKRFYCAWDNEKDLKRIQRGLSYLDEAEINRSYITPYFLCNYWQKGLTDDVWGRFILMAEWGLRPYCMIYEKWTLPVNDELKVFQNWVNSYKAYTNPTKEGFKSYKEYYKNRKSQTG